MADWNSTFSHVQLPPNWKRLSVSRVSGFHWLKLQRIPEDHGIKLPAAQEDVWKDAPFPAWRYIISLAKCVLYVRSDPIIDSFCSSSYTSAVLLKKKIPDYLKTQWMVYLVHGHFLITVYIYIVATHPLVSFLLKWVVGKACIGSPPPMSSRHRNLEP